MIVISQTDDVIQSTELNSHVKVAEPNGGNGNQVSDKKKKKKKKKSAKNKSKQDVSDDDFEHVINEFKSANISSYLNEKDSDTVAANSTKAVIDGDKQPRDKSIPHFLSANDPELSEEAKRQAKFRGNGDAQLSSAGAEGGFQIRRAGNGQWFNSTWGAIFFPILRAAPNVALYVARRISTGTLRPPMTKDMAAAAHYDSATVRAYSQKDKLLLFDREHAKRTHVHDAQADYYESSAWLTAEEKKQIDDKLRKKKELRERRPTTKRITLDLAGRKIVEYIRKEDDDEDDILESHGQLNPSSSQIEEHHVYANDELEGRGSRAGEVYRMMREKWELKGK
eukprot:gene26600-35272_t